MPTASRPVGQAQAEKKAAAAAATSGCQRRVGPDRCQRRVERGQDARSQAQAWPQGAPTGELSPTLVFVANVAFSTTDESLKAALASTRSSRRTWSSAAAATAPRALALSTLRTPPSSSAPWQRAEHPIDGRQVSLQVPCSRTGTMQTRLPMLAATPLPPLPPPPPRERSNSVPTVNGRRGSLEIRVSNTHPRMLNTP